jgi:hypothetical protein
MDDYIPLHLFRLLLEGNLRKLFVFVEYVATGVAKNRKFVTFNRSLVQKVPEGLGQRS